MFFSDVKLLVLFLGPNSMVLVLVLAFVVLFNNV